MDYALIKKHRLIWDSSLYVLGNPFVEYPEKSITHTNTSRCFESDETEDIQNKIDELGLIYIYDE